MLFHHNPQKHDQVGAMVAMFQIRKGGLAEVSNLTQSHWDQSWDVTGQPRPLAVCCPSVLPGWRLLKGNDDSCSEMLGGEGVKVGFPRRVPTCSPTSLCTSWEEGRSQSSEKAAAWPRAKVVSYSSCMSPELTNTRSYNSIALIPGLDRA